MKLKLTKKNFDYVLNAFVKKSNAITDVDLLELDEGEVLEFHQVNHAMIASTNRVRAIGEIYSLMQRLELWAKKQYDLKKANAILEARKLKEDYPSSDDRKAYAEKQAEPERERYEGVHSLREGMHRDRQDLWDYRKRLEIISKNLQAEAYAGR